MKNHALVDVQLLHESAELWTEHARQRSFIRSNDVDDGTRLSLGSGRPAGHSPYDSRNRSQTLEPGSLPFSRSAPKNSSSL